MLGCNRKVVWWWKKWEEKMKFFTLFTKVIKMIVFVLVSLREWFYMIVIALDGLGSFSFMLVCKLELIFLFCRFGSIMSCFTSWIASQAKELISMFAWRLVIVDCFEFLDLDLYWWSSWWWIGLKVRIESHLDWRIEVSNMVLINRKVC